MKYRTIVADPPWEVRTGRLLGATRGWKMRESVASQPVSYPTMSLDEIAELPVADLADPNAHLYLWTINRYVENAYDIARAWGFRPSTLITWTKTPMGSGLGGCWGITTEHVLFCRRGKLRAIGRSNSTWFATKRQYENGAPAHSKKPDAFLDLVEQVSPGPYLELFARRQRLGWDTWGDEALCHVNLDVASLMASVGSDATVKPWRP
jgi:N6-adenosine-specific RNA methylase IME4